MVLVLVVNGLSLVYLILVTYQLHGSGTGDSTGDLEFNNGLGIKINGTGALKVQVVIQHNW